MNGGAEQLFKGTSQLRLKEGELVSGISQLNAGAKKLSEGVDQMAEEGLKKLSKLSDSDLALASLTRSMRWKMRRRATNPLETEGIMTP